MFKHRNNGICVHAVLRSMWQNPKKPNSISKFRCAQNLFQNSSFNSNIFSFWIFWEFAWKLYYISNVCSVFVFESLSRFPITTTTTIHTGTQYIQTEHSFVWIDLIPKRWGILVFGVHHRNTHILVHCIINDAYLWYACLSLSCLLASFISRAVYSFIEIVSSYADILILSDAKGFRIENPIVYCTRLARMLLYDLDEILVEVVEMHALSSDRNDGKFII